MNVGHKSHSHNFDNNYEGTIIVEDIEDQTVKVPIVLNFNPSDLLDDSEPLYQFPIYENQEMEEQNQTISIRSRPIQQYIPHRKTSISTQETTKQFNKRNSISNDEFLKQMKMDSTYQPINLEKYQMDHTENLKNQTSSNEDFFKRITIGKQLEELGKKGVSTSLNSFAQFEEIVKSIQKNPINPFNNVFEETSGISIQQIQQPVTKSTLPPGYSGAKRYSLDGKIGLPRLPNDGSTTKKRNSIPERRNSQETTTGKRNSIPTPEKIEPVQKKQNVETESSFEQEKKKFKTELEDIGLLRKNSSSTPTNFSPNTQNISRRNSSSTNRKLSDQTHQQNFMFHVYTPENEQNQPRKSSSTPDVFHMYLPNQPKSKKTQKPTFSITTQTFHVYSPDSQQDDKKRKKKTKEKRLSKKRSKISTKEIQRIDESLSEKFLVLTRKVTPNEDGKLQDFDFDLFSFNENNINQVHIGVQPTCSCNDYEKGTCKHLFFCFLKVLGIHRDSDLIYQRALLSSELESMDGNDIILKKEDFCYLCCNSLLEKELTFCNFCGTKVHSECWKKCCTINVNHGCLFCEKK